MSVTPSNLTPTGQPRNWGGDGRLFGTHVLFNNPVTENRGGMKTYIDDAARLGSEVIRLPTDWSQIEPWNGAFDANYIRFLTDIIAYAKQKGIKVVLMMGRTPQWAVPSWVPSSQAEWYPPQNPYEYANAMGELYRRVAAKGLADNVIGWEVGNEPNSTEFWGAANGQVRDGTYVNVTVDQADKYVDILNATYDTLKSINPNITVVGGALAGTDWQYLDRMLARGARYDVLSVHPYTSPADETPNGYVRSPSDIPNPNESDFLEESLWSFSYGLDRLRQVMNSRGKKTELWLTEFGTSWGTGWGEAGSPEAQARYIREALSLVSDMGDVPVAVAHALYDQDYNGDWWPEERMGMMSVDGQIHQSGSVLREYATADDSMTAPPPPPPSSPPPPPPSGNDATTLAGLSTWQQVEAVTSNNLVTQGELDLMARTSEPMIIRSNGKYALAGEWVLAQGEQYRIQMILDAIQRANSQTSDARSGDVSNLSVSSYWEKIDKVTANSYVSRAELDLLTQGTNPMVTRTNGRYELSGAWVSHQGTAQEIRLIEEAISRANGA